MGFLLIGKIKVLTFFRVALSDFSLLRVVLRLVLRLVLRPIILWLQSYYLLVVFRGYFGGGGLQYVH